MAAFASSGIVQLPSDAIECMCRSPLMSCRVVSSGSACFFAACISPLSSRSSGGI